MAYGVGAFDSINAFWSYVALSLQRRETQATWAQQYDLLRAYYLNNGLYEVLDKAFSTLGAKKQELRPLRNPAHRAVEFYAAKLWPGPLESALPVVTENEAAAQAIAQVWQWSNWAVKKQAAARTFAWSGDLFLKVATRTDEATGEVARVFIQSLEPRVVTEMEADERGFVVYVRLDTPEAQRRQDGVTETIWLTEVWDKVAGTMRRWRHTRGPTTPLAQLGPAQVSVEMEQFGIDFVPIVWQPFRDVGDERGAGCFVHALDKIDEANRQATRLHQMLFRNNRALWALTAGGNDAQGRPLPPPRVGGDGTDRLEVDDDTILRLPGASDMKSLVAPLAYADALAVLNAQMEEIARDLPELAYYQVREMGEVSGRAVALLLGDAVDRALEARGNGEAALVRADEMALTVGVQAGLFGDIGTYEAGDFAHSFAARPILTETEQDEAETAQAWVNAGLPLRTTLRRQGWTETEIAEMEADQDVERLARRSFASVMIDAAQGDLDAGEV